MLNPSRSFILRRRCSKLTHKSLLNSRLLHCAISWHYVQQLMYELRTKINTVILFNNQLIAIKKTTPCSSSVFVKFTTKIKLPRKYPFLLLLNFALQTHNGLEFIFRFFIFFYFGTAFWHKYFVHHIKTWKVTTFAALLYQWV